MNANQTLSRAQAISIVESWAARASRWRGALKANQGSPVGDTGGKDINGISDIPRPVAPPPEGGGIVRAGADLRGADLRGASLRWADFTEADLSGADLTGGDIQMAIFTGANLTEANLRGANLRGAYFWGAYLRGANLRGANLWGAYLRGAILSGADLTEADLREANLRGADLRGAILRWADLRRADLQDAKGIIAVGPLGVEKRTIYAVSRDHGVMVQAGCFWGPMATLRAAITTRYADGTGREAWRAEYLDACDRIEAWYGEDVSHTVEQAPREASGPYADEKGE